MCWRGSDRYFEAVRADKSSPNSVVNGEVQSIPKVYILGGAPREGIDLWVRPCRSQDENRGCGNCVGSSGEVTRAWQNGELTNQTGLG